MDIYLFTKVNNYKIRIPNPICFGATEKISYLSWQLIILKCVSRWHPGWKRIVHNTNMHLVDFEHINNNGFRLMTQNVISRNNFLIYSFREIIYQLQCAFPLGFKKTYIYYIFAVNIPFNLVNPFSSGNIHHKNSQS